MNRRKVKDTEDDFKILLIQIKIIMIRIIAALVADNSIKYIFLSIIFYSNLV